MYLYLIKDAKKIIEIANDGDDRNLNFWRERAKRLARSIVASAEWEHQQLTKLLEGETNETE